MWLSKKERQMIKQLREQEEQALKDDIIRLDGGINTAVMQAIIDRAEDNPNLVVEIHTTNGDRILIKSHEQTFNGRRVSIFNYD